jgi:TM2 domain-containing membrane protein YozV
VRGELELIGNETLLQLGMTASQQTEFLAQMAPVRKSRRRAAWLAALLGGVGAHHFYLEQPDRGWRCALFCWTGVPVLIGWWELLTIGQRVDRYNAVRARAIASRVKAAGPSPKRSGPAGLKDLPRARRVVPEPLNL